MSTVHTNGLKGVPIGSLKDSFCVCDYIEAVLEGVGLELFARYLYQILFPPPLGPNT